MVHTDRQTNILFILYEDDFSGCYLFWGRITNFGQVVVETKILLWDHIPVFFLFHYFEFIKIFVLDLVPENTPVALKMDVEGYECKVNHGDDHS